MLSFFPSSVPEFPWVSALEDSARAHAIEATVEGETASFVSDSSAEFLCLKCSWAA